MDATRDPPIYTVSEMIEKAFGDPKKNVVNLKLIQVLLMIFARRLNVLDRWIPVVAASYDPAHAHHISVSQMKIHAKRRHLGKKGSHHRSHLRMRSHTSETGMQKSVDRLEKISEIEKSKETLSPDEITQSQGELKSETRELDEGGDLLVSAILSELKKQSREVMSTADLQQENLLIEQPPEKTAEGSQLVSQDQFQKLVDAVIELQKKYGPVEMPDVPDKVQGMQESAPLSSATGAMQLAESMEIVESSIERLYIMLREIVIVKIKEAKAAARREQDLEDEEEEDIEGGGGRGAFAPGPMMIYAAESGKTVPKSKPKSAGSTGPGTTPEPSATVTHSEVDTAASDIASEMRKVTVDELETSMWDMYDECFKVFLNSMKKCNTNTAVTKERTAKYDGKLKMTSIADEVMEELEAKVLKYTSRIDEINNMFSVSTLNIQDQLARMNHDLEGGLMYFFESYSKQPKRHAAIAELIGKFIDKLEELEEAKTVLVEFKVGQAELFKRLSDLRDELKCVANVKSNRTEMHDALANKVSLRRINGFILKAQGYAVQGDMEKKIKLAYEKFNTQEYLWQKGLDDLTRYLNDRVDLKQLDSFKNATKRVADMITAKLNYMMKVVGNAPKEMKISKKIMRKEDCPSCGAPMTKAMENLKKENKDPNVCEERAKGKQVRDKKIKNKKERDVCFPGLPVPSGRICYKYGASTFEPLPSIDIKQFRQPSSYKTQIARQKGNPCPCDQLPNLVLKQGVCGELCTNVPCECFLPEPAAVAEPCDELCTETPCECVLPKPVPAEPCDELCTEVPCECVTPKSN